MPDGSSSAAPVTMPGPNAERTARSVLFFGVWVMGVSGWPAALREPVPPVARIVSERARGHGRTWVGVPLGAARELDRFVVRRRRREAGGATKRGAVQERGPPQP